MPDLTALLSVLKSPKTALAVLLFSTSLLFFPFDAMGLKRPSFTTEYEALIVVAMFLSGALLVVDLFLAGWRMVQKPLLARQRKTFVTEAFLSLNLQELSVLWAMTQAGTRTIKGPFDSPVMISLRQKGVLGSSLVRRAR
ncbi:super-infection exclusion protein B [Paracoccus sp. S-4012]|uniref:super-infection exclusion protein B n=1 Tax=Paracoccus sp. S-4012 TaxID=2665648 RepID=UPI001E57A07B|nr:super-infection exclusion protein B [Paracoccus sp. S-4012]